MVTFFDCLVISNVPLWKAKIERGAALSEAGSENIAPKGLAQISKVRFRWSLMWFACKSRNAILIRHFTIGLHGTRGSIDDSHPAALGKNLKVLKMFMTNSRVGSFLRNKDVT